MLSIMVFRLVDRVIEPLQIKCPQYVSFLNVNCIQNVKSKCYVSYGQTVHIFKGSFHLKSQSVHEDIFLNYNVANNRKKVKVLTIFYVYYWIECEKTIKLRFSNKKISKFLEIIIMKPFGDGWKTSRYLGAIRNIKHTKNKNFCLIVLVVWVDDLSDH